LALANPHIKSEAIEAMEFSELAQKHNVYGVPKIVFNDGKSEQEGNVPEQVFVQRLMEAF